LNVIGNGVVIDPYSFKLECDEIESLGVNLSEVMLISERAHLILPTHKALDKASELAKGINKIGSTLKGIGPTYMDKIGRNGLRVGDIMKSDFNDRYLKLKEKHLQLLKDVEGINEDIAIWEEQFYDSIENLKKYQFIAAEYWLNEQLKSGKKILAEGAQGTMLDIDFGTYPFVTSSNTVTAGLCVGLGIAPKWVGKVYGISKAYCTRVGSGPFPSELENEVGEKLRKLGNEFGSTTGRPRRCGWIDLVALKYACMINGVDEIIVTKADVLDDMESVSACIEYAINGNTVSTFPYDILENEIKPVYETLPIWETPISTCKTKNELPINFLTLISLIEKVSKTKVSYISNGVGRDQLIEM